MITWTLTYVTPHSVNTQCFGSESELVVALGTLVLKEFHTPGTTEYRELDNAIKAFRRVAIDDAPLPALRRFVEKAYHKAKPQEVTVTTAKHMIQPSIDGEASKGFKDLPMAGVVTVPVLAPPRERSLFGFHQEWMNGKAAKADYSLSTGTGLGNPAMQFFYRSKDTNFSLVIDVPRLFDSLVGIADKIAQSK